MIDSKILKQRIILLITGTLAIPALLASHNASEQAWLKMRWFHSKAFPTLINIRRCSGLLEYYPQQEITHPEDFNSFIEKALLKYKTEYGSMPTSFEDVNSIDKTTKDAWGKRLHFSYENSLNPGYKIFSAGEDGLIGTKDDIANGDIVRKQCKVAKKNSMLLYLLPPILFVIFGFTLLKQNNPVKRGTRILITSLVLIFLYSLLMPEVQPSYAMPQYLIETFVEAGIFAGFVLGGILLGYSKEWGIKILGCLFAITPFALWAYVFGLV